MIKWKYFAAVNSKFGLMWRFRKAFNTFSAFRRTANSRRLLLVRSPLHSNGLPPPHSANRLGLGSDTTQEPTLSESDSSRIQIRKARLRLCTEIVQNCARGQALTHGRIHSVRVTSNHISRMTSIWCWWHQKYIFLIKYWCSARIWTAKLRIQTKFVAFLLKKTMFLTSVLHFY